MNAKKLKFAKLFLLANLFVLGSILLWQAYNIQDKEKFNKEQDIVINTLEDSVAILESDILFAIDLLEGFLQEKDSIQLLLDQQRLVEVEPVQIIEKDTVVVTPDGKNVMDSYDLLINEVVKFNGGAFELQAISSFKWDYVNNRPYEENFDIKNFRVNLNVTTKLEPLSAGYEIDVLPLTDFVKITYIGNNKLTGEDFLRRVPSRVSFGLHGGYGFTSQGLTPFVGIGVTYNLIDLTEILKD
jgi:hypothetical protein|tara:strand:+ start:171 stop:896 length:726 start_codon:yes stop_codon:yes gene_type:complete